MHVNMMTMHAERKYAFTFVLQSAPTFFCLDYRFTKDEIFVKSLFRKNK